MPQWRPTIAEYIKKLEKKKKMVESTFSLLESGWAL